MSTWFDTLEGDLQQQLLDLQRVEGWRHLKILLLVAMWLSAGWVAIESTQLWLQLPCWILIGFSLHGLGIFMHEGAHGNLLGRKVIDRLVGAACGFPVLFSCSCYRATHALHHRFENTADDPDNLRQVLPHSGLRKLIIVGFLLVGTPLYSLWTMLTAPFLARTLGERVACVAEAMILVALLAMASASAAEHPRIREILVEGWLLGLVFAMPIANFRALAEHTLVPMRAPSDAVWSTRSLPAMRWVSFFFNNQNYHLEHHLFPSVQWYNLPKIHGLLEETYQRQRAEVSSYPEFGALLFRQLMPGRSNAAV